VRAPERVTIRDGRALTLRPPKADDGPAFSAYMGVLARDTPWTGTLPHEVRAPDAMRDRIAEVLARDAALWWEFALDDEGAVVADCMGIGSTRAKCAHVAQIGIGITEPWRGAGLGRLLMERLIAWARASPDVEKLELGVFGANAAARRLYESLGFEHEGARRRARRQPDGSYHDDILMGLWTGAPPSIKERPAVKES